MRKIIPLFVLLPAVIALLMLVSQLPPYGNADNPIHNEVSARYLEQGVEEAGALNIVTNILVDYRAYDTLIETTLLFTALFAVMLVLKGDDNHA